MSTLDVTCGRCDKSFRVRAEFAGRATRCPGCSAPLTIGGPAKAEPRPRLDEPAERPRPRPTDADDDRPRRPAGNWKPVDTALGREQAALLCLLVQVGCLLLVACLAAVSRPFGGDGTVLIIPIAILVGGPALAAVVFGISARLAATGAPKESNAQGAARASLLSSFIGLACLAFFALAFLISIDSQRRDELPMVVAVGGLFVSLVAALGTFAGFVVQIGIARRSADVARGVGRLAVAATICSSVLIGIGGLYAVANEAFTPNYSPNYGRGSYYPYPDHSGFYRVVVFGLIPISLVVMLVLYHRLLAAARRSVRGSGPEDR